MSFFCSCLSSTSAPSPSPKPAGHRGSSDRRDLKVIRQSSQCNGSNCTEACSPSGTAANVPPQVQTVKQPKVLVSLDINNGCSECKAASAERKAYQNGSSAVRTPPDSGGSDVGSRLGSMRRQTNGFRYGNDSSNWEGDRQHQENHDKSVGCGGGRGSSSSNSSNMCTCQEGTTTAAVTTPSSKAINRKSLSKPNEKKNKKLLLPHQPPSPPQLQYSGSQFGGQFDQLYCTCCLCTGCSVVTSPVTTVSTAAAYNNSHYNQRNKAGLVAAPVQVPTPYATNAHHNQRNLNLTSSQQQQQQQQAYNVAYPSSPSDVCFDRYSFCEPIDPSCECCVASLMCPCNCGPYVTNPVYCSPGPGLVASKAGGQARPSSRGPRTSTPNNIRATTPIKLRSKQVVVPMMGVANGRGDEAPSSAAANVLCLGNGYVEQDVIANTVTHSPYQWPPAIEYCTASGRGCLVDSASNGTSLTRAQAMRNSGYRARSPPGDYHQHQHQQYRPGSAMNNRQGPVPTTTPRRASSLRRTTSNPPGGHVNRTTTTTTFSSKTDNAGKGPSRPSNVVPLDFLASTVNLKIEIDSTSTTTQSSPSSGPSPPSRNSEELFTTTNTVGKPLANVTTNTATTVRATMTLPSTTNQNGMTSSISVSNITTLNSTNMSTVPQAPEKPKPIYRPPPRDATKIGAIASLGKLSAAKFKAASDGLNQDLNQDGGESSATLSHLTSVRERLAKAKAAFLDDGVPSSSGAKPKSRTGSRSASPSK